MLNSCYPADDGDEILPALLLRPKHLPALRRQTVISPPALLGLFHPAPLDGSLLFQPMEQGIERGNVKSQGAAGSDLNQLRNVIPVARLILEQRQHQKLCASFLPFMIGRT